MWHHARPNIQSLAHGSCQPRGDPSVKTREKNNIIQIQQQQQQQQQPQQQQQQPQQQQQQQQQR